MALIFAILRGCRATAYEMAMIIFQLLPLLKNIKMPGYFLNNRAHSTPFSTQTAAAVSPPMSIYEITFILFAPEGMENKAFAKTQKGPDKRQVFQPVALSSPSFPANDQPSAQAKEL